MMIHYQRRVEDLSTNKTMKVKQLIEELQKYPEDMDVMKCGYEGGYKDLSVPVEKDNILLNVNDEWYYGPHESEDNVPGREKEKELLKDKKEESKKDYEKVKALII